MDEFAPDDALRVLLDTFTVAGSDIEARVMAQIEHEAAEPFALGAEIAALRADVAAMRTEMAELKRILLSGRTGTFAPPAPADSRGKSLLPYARPDKALPILS